ncbi:N-acetylglutamate synthase [Teratosphaeria nubilosa]|uniref:Amino-acid acetyltransferase, mitochondrial n=1 Tax=Teratosphaeria nubilosa TaxID=161662 RepID=A0A6G1LN86_9PEZI|nr:N-acetylglutamate synthase [Teratosphaeria nubilosa]
MTTSMWLCGKASVTGSLKPVTTVVRSYATNAATNGNGWRPVDDPATQRELFMDVLSANATKRDAKQYLARFRPPKQPANAQQATPDGKAERNAQVERTGVNLGGLYPSSRAIADTPQFSQEAHRATVEEGIHVALVCLRAPQKLDDTTLEGLTTTLAQLVKLDMRVVLVMELDEFASTYEHENVRLRRKAFAEQALRLSHAMRMQSPDGSRFITGALETDEAATNFGESEIKIATPQLILEPLGRGIVPIVPCLAYTPTGQLVEARVTDVMAGLAELLSGQVQHSKALQEKYERTTLDRIIVLDPAGGIPSKSRGDKAHVFVNIEQEFDDIVGELSEYAGSCDQTGPRVYQQHQENLRMLRRCLGMLPSASSALIIAPKEAAQASKTSDATLGTGTRRQKNTLIYNLLTNKPLVSSSLPAARMSSSFSSTDPAHQSTKTATLVKRGMPLTIIPAADRHTGWQRPETGYTSLCLDNDPRVDLPRLVHLVNDSFRRKLDTPAYLDRIKGRIAGLIVAGNYEGAAILTWEQPPGTTSPSRLVPYLDKFAVLQSSQGSAGVADTLFQAMVRSCFPNGVCWRSRKDNPVNKWYFERAAGSWQIPETNWTMFWTGEGVVENEERWRDYVGVCRAIVPTWADGGKKPD